MKNRKEYEVPTVSVVFLSSPDVITSSGIGVGSAPKPGDIDSGGWQA